MATQAKAEIGASVDVRPVRSHVFLTALVVVAALALLSAVGLFVVKHDAAWLFFLTGTVLLFAAYRGWEKSQADIDLEQAHPTSVAIPGGMSVSTDSRTLRSPEALLALQKILGDGIHRQRLPRPTALVDAEGKPVSGTQAEAAARVAEINVRTEADAACVVEALGLSSLGAGVIQSPSDVAVGAPNTELDQSINRAER